MQLLKIETTAQPSYSWKPSPLVRVITLLEHLATTFEVLFGWCIYMHVLVYGPGTDRWLPPFLHCERSLYNNLNTQQPGIAFVFLNFFITRCALRMSWQWHKWKPCTLRMYFKKRMGNGRWEGEWCPAILKIFHSSHSLLPKFVFMLLIWICFVDHS